MGVIKRLSKEDINKDFDHYGLFYGIVPVYVGDPYGEARVAVRNWIPEWTLDLANIFFDLVTITVQIANPNFEPLFFFHLTGKINNG